MKPTVVIPRRLRLEHRYQAILRQDWTERTLPVALDLLEELLLPDVRLAAPGARGKARSSSATRYDIPATATEDLREFLEGLDSGFGPKVPSSIPPPRAGKTKLSLLARRTLVLLTIQRAFMLEGESGLFRDTQSVAFLCAVEFLLAELRSHGLREEHDLLVNALFAHTSLAWTDQPAQACYLRSAVASHLGQTEVSAHLLYLAFSLTPPTDHDYVTKAQAYWSMLLDAGNREGARGFIMAVHRAAPAQHLPEIEALISATFLQGEPRQATATRRH
ncbi:MAG: hypothetical protein HYY06_00700 [Deltaproteobacteria bacterium]|nr:hypothetical protein [Deltaproteobacteria bacterium]